MTIKLNDLPPNDSVKYLQSAIAPRPIGLVSSLDLEGNVNLSPFSFFNLFSLNPPILIFSPSRRVRDNTLKHTLENIREVPEVVVHICDYEMVEQISLASSDYDKGVNEFIKAGFTEEKAVLVRPPMVKEAKIKMECRVNQIIPLGNEGGAGNLVLCEIILLHIEDEILGNDQQIDPLKMSFVARLGGNWYSKIDKTNLFQIEKPGLKPGIGIDALPEFIRKSSVLNKSDLAQLAGVSIIPSYLPANDTNPHPRLTSQDPSESLNKHFHAKKLLEDRKVELAWQTLLEP